MLIVHGGLYRWAPRRIAFRRDYCRHCAAETLSVFVRTFNVIHLFWLPLLPLGVWGRWLCVRCGSNPHAAPQIRRGFKVALAVLVALFNLAAWVVPPGTVSDLEKLIVRAGAFVLLLVCIRWAAVHHPEPEFASRLAALQPYDQWECPLCASQLVRAPPLVYCPSCKVEHRPLPARPPLEAT